MSRYLPSSVRTASVRTACRQPLSERAASSTHSEGGLSKSPREPHAPNHAVLFAHTSRLQIVTMSSPPSSPHRRRRRHSSVAPPPRACQRHRVPPGVGAGCRLAVTHTDKPEAASDNTPHRPGNAASVPTSSVFIIGGKLSDSHIQAETCFTYVDATMKVRTALNLRGT